MKKLMAILLLAMGCWLTGGAQDNSTTQNPQKNQAVLTLKDGSKKYYNTDSVSSMDARLSIFMSML